MPPSVSTSIDELRLVSPVRPDVYINTLKRVFKGETVSVPVHGAAANPVNAREHTSVLNVGVFRIPVWSVFVLPLETTRHSTTVSTRNLPHEHSVSSKFA